MRFYGFLASEPQPAGHLLKNFRIDHGAMRESVEIYPRTGRRVMKSQEFVVASHRWEDQVLAGSGVDRHQRATDASLAEAA